MSTESLNQSQRESLINILVLGMYLDSHLSILEDDALNALLESFGWESGTSRSVFLNDSISRATHLADDAATAEYVRSNVKAFDSAQAKSDVLVTLTSFLNVDGVAGAEAQFLSQVSQALK
jgi:hypothetical protein